MSYQIDSAKYREMAEANTLFNAPMDAQQMKLRTILSMESPTSDSYEALSQMLDICIRCTTFEKLDRLYKDSGLSGQASYCNPMELIGICTGILTDKLIREIPEELALEA